MWSKENYLSQKSFFCYEQVSMNVVQNELMIIILFDKDSRFYVTSSGEKMLQIIESTGAVH